ncbi:MAG: homoserine dehydrogenase [Acidobacteria bacterium]|nr:homoserine dehydrogenase [Acidobacteriota bacterium]
MKTYNLCLLGFGNVGRALARLLAAKAEEMRAEFGVAWRITGVASRRLGWGVAREGFDVGRLLAGEVASEASPAPREVREWIEAARGEVVFETTSLEPRTGQPAIDYARAALESNAHVVTANKGTVAHAYAELSGLARERGRRFMFEATVADCLPVFSLFRECLPAARLSGFRALLNSTTTVILEEIERGRTFDEGVERAQLMGIAETDPTYDVDGWDATVKVCALANVLMGETLGAEEIERVGIRALDAMHVRAAREEGKPFRLLSRAWRDAGGRLRASVRPEQLEPGDQFATLGGSSLAVTFELDVLPGLTVVASAPNLKSTAYGLLADFLNVARDEGKEGR